MLEYLCDIPHATHLHFESHHSHTISVYPEHASKDGVIRVIRYMRRWCISSNRAAHITSIKEGIARYNVCRFFGLNANIEHMQRLVVDDFMSRPRFFVADQDVELIRRQYEGMLQDKNCQVTRLFGLSLNTLWEIRVPSPMK